MRKVTLKEKKDQLRFRDIHVGDTFVEELDEVFINVLIKTDGTDDASNVTDFDGVTYDFGLNEPVFLVACDVTVEIL